MSEGEEVRGARREVRRCEVRGGVCLLYYIYRVLVLLYILCTICPTLSLTRISLVYEYTVYTVRGQGISPRLPVD